MMHALRGYLLPVVRVVTLALNSFVRRHIDSEHPQIHLEHTSSECVSSVSNLNFDNCNVSSILFALKLL